MKRPVRLSNNKKRKLKMLVDQAVQALMMQRNDLCEQLCAKIEAIQPGNADVANIRGIQHVEKDETKAAEDFFVQAINAAPKRADFHENLGKLYLKEGLYADAMARFRSAMQYSPSSLEAKLGYCAALVASGPSEEALGILEGLRRKHPEHRHVLMGLFDALSRLDRSEACLQVLNEVVQHYPQDFEARFQRSQLWMQLGKMQEGETELRAALALNPGHARSYAILSGLKKFSDGKDADIQSIESWYDKSGPESHDRVFLCNALGKVYADLKDYDKSFAFYEECNAIRQRNTRYDADTELSHLESIISSYTPEVISHSSGLDDERPVFIVGMPRCGSTLTEQILAAHPEVSSRGEWTALERALFDYQNPDEPLTLDRITSFGAEQWRDIGQAFLGRLDAGEPGRRITDKTLGNIRLVGAIHCALPKARIIHVRRNPLDTCVSIYTSNIQGGQFDFGLSQGSLGYYYRMYQRLMQHWREVLPGGVMYELDYEQLVANQEEETRKLLDYCGLEWSDACLAFQRADTRVKTASILQVRQSLYSGSVQRWRRYEKHLQPLIRILGTD